MIEVRPGTTQPGRMLLRTQQHFSELPESLLVFFADAANLEAIAPPWLNFRRLTQLTIVMDPGTLMDDQSRLHWIPIRWRTEILACEPPYQFVDQQLQGPYRIWTNTHTFEPNLNKIFAHLQQSLAKRLTRSTPATAR